MKLLILRISTKEYKLL